MQHLLAVFIRILAESEDSTMLGRIDHVFIWPCHDTTRILRKLFQLLFSFDKTLDQFFIFFCRITYNRVIARFCIHLNDRQCTGCLILRIWENIIFVFGYIRIRPAAPIPVIQCVIRLVDLFLGSTYIIQDDLCGFFGLYKIIIQIIAARIVFYLIIQRL